MPTRPRSSAGRWPTKIRAEVPGRIDYVVGPAIGGLIPAYETSRHLGVPAIWVEREGGVFRLRRFEIEKGARVVIVEDIVTTGLSIRETIAVPARARRRGAGGRLHHRPLGRQDRCRRAADRARRIRGAGLSGRPAAAGTGGDSGGEAGQPEHLSAHDHRHRQRPDRHPPHREVAGAPWRALHRAHLHRDRAGAGRGPAQGAPPPMPSASPPRRPAPRRWAPAFREGVFWRDMGVVNLPGGKPTMQLTGGAAARLERLAAARAPRRDPPDDHRRISAGAGIRDHRGGAVPNNGHHGGFRRLLGIVIAP